MLTYVAVELINEQRHPDQQFDALYILQATSRNVDLLVADFARRPLYASAHVFFVNPLDDRLFKILTNSPASRYMKNLIELFLDFFPLESQLYSFRNSHSFLMLYNPECRSLREREVKTISSKMISLCASLGEYPVIRYHRPQLQIDGFGSEISTKVANLIQTELDEYARNNSDFPPPSSRPRSTLLILDRSIDIVAPLVHEFTYQSMAHDLIDFENGTKYKFEIEGPNGLEEKTMGLEEDDTLWTEIRHMHMRETIDMLMQEFNTFIAENTNFTDKDKATSLNDMRDMLASLPQFQETRDRFSLHMALAQECMKIFEQRKLPLIGLVEQNCAVRWTSDGRLPKTVLEEMVPLLADPALSVSDRQRLLLLYIIFKDGLLEEDLKKLVMHAGLSSREAVVFKNLDLLGLKATTDLKAHKNWSKVARRRKIPETDEDAYEISRYVPALQYILESLQNGTLSKENFPFTKDEPVDATIKSQGSLRRARPNWAKQRPAVRDDRQRVIVYIIGGATYSEARVAYQLSESQNVEVILGSSDFITPERFVKNLTRARDPKDRLEMASTNFMPNSKSNMF